MLVFPESLTTIIKIVAIDPGTRMLGVAILSLDVATMKIVATEAMTFNSEKMLTLDEVVEETYSERMAKILAQKKNLIKIFNYYNPAYICCESPFFNRLQPSAYGPLMEILTAIQMAGIEFNPLVKFTLYPPSVVKKSLGGSHIADKTSIRDQLLLRNDLCFKGTYSLDKLDEHSLDAIAVGLCHYEILKKRYK